MSEAKVSFRPETLKEYEEIAKRYPDRRATLLPALWLAQRDFGWLSQDVQAYVAGLVGVSPAHVQEVAEFYTMYHKKPAGKYHVQVCRTLSCALAGSGKILETLKEVLGVQPGERTPDGKFSLQEVECLASCHTAPCVQINDEYYEGLTPEKLRELIEKLRREGGAS